MTQTKTPQGNRITKVEITRLDNGHLQVAVTKEFAPEHGGGEQTFLEAGGVSWHYALDVARGMVTMSPGQRTDYKTVPARRRFREHDIEFPEWLRALTFEDESWHNDACAKALLYLNRETHEALRVWIDYEFEEDRDSPSSDRYVLEYVPNEDAHCDGTAQALYSGESEQDLEAAVMTYLRTPKLFVGGKG